MSTRWLITTFLGMSAVGFGFPNVCDVVETPHFERELGLSVRNAWCPSSPPWPPWPCSHVSYNVPRYFIEVVNHPKETMFSGLPGVRFQLRGMRDIAPFAAEDSTGAFSYHAHAIHVPFTWVAFAGMPCGGALPDLTCFSAASEHLGSRWNSGYPDMVQPQVLFWAPKPAACLKKGAAMSVTGQWGMTGGGIEPMCSFKLPWWIRRYPPTDAPVCTGWGQHLPRSGTVTSSDQTTASLVIASRIKSIAGDVYRSVGSNPTDKWQMIYPQVSSSFREGQNIGYLRLMQVNEVGRLGGKFTKFLYVIWQQTTCTVDRITGNLSKVWIKGVKAACKGLN